MDAQAPAPAKRAGLIFIFITVLLDIMGIGLIIPIMPQLVASFLGGDLSTASRYFGGLAACYTAMQFLFSPMLGALSDRYGRKPILLGSLLLTALSYLTLGLAPTLAWVFVARTMSGLGGASLTVASTYIADVSSPETRAQNYGLLGAAFGLGFIIGPALGGFLGAFDPRMPFFVAAGLSLLNFLYGLFVVPESHAVENRRAFTWAQANPVAWIALLRRHPIVMGLAVSMILQGLAQNGLQSNWVLFTTYRFHWSPTENGISLAVVGLSAALVQGGLIRVLLPRLGERRAILFGLALAAVAFLAYGLATQGWMMYAIVAVASIAGIAGPAVQGMVSKQVGPDEQGAVQGALTSLMSLTGIVGPIVANQLFAEFTAPSAPVKLPGIAFFLGAALTAIALFNMVRLFNRIPAQAIEQAPVSV
ncbi:MAG TPA: TCR/Tet family MFS transporter [Pantanalinema sp.]